jgi:1,2-diacylglycerol 3-alpha-glucosyltransferase
MRILIAGNTQYLAFHGQATFTVNLAEGLARQGHEVLAVVNSENGRAYRTQRNGVQIEALRAVSLELLHPDTYYPLLPTHSVRRIFATFRPQVVHIQDHYLLSQVVMRVARHYGVKVVGTNHFMPENLAPYIPGYSLGKPAFDWFLWRWMLNTFNQLDMASAPSRTAAALLNMEGLHPPVFPVSCGIDLSRFCPRPDVDRLACRERFGLDPSRTIFLFVGRVDREKRIDLLLRAVQRLDRNDVQLAIAGQGAALNELKELAEELGLGQRVRFTGYVPSQDLPDLLNSVDIFVMPSAAELLSIATLEAMACARPILAARAVALPELVGENVNGYLFRAGDVADAARCMGLLADQPERWASMGAASLEKARFHSLDNTIHHYETLYQAVLEGVPKRGVQAALSRANRARRKPSKNRRPSTSQTNI